MMSSNRISNAPMAPSLPASENTGTSKGGRLTATILSVYDLPDTEQPIAVSLKACGVTVTTGPPLSRRKNSNSYKFFDGGNGRKSELKIDGRLQDLYQSTAILAVEYKNPQQRLIARVRIKTLHVHETQWLNLDLKRDDSTASAAAAGATTVDSTLPNLRLKMLLEGPFRPEIAALVSLGQAWFGVVDSVDNSCSKVMRSVPKTNLNLSSKYFLIPAVPLATALVALSPIFVGVLVVGMPLFLPILVVVAGVLAGVVAAGTVLYFSTPAGREQVGQTLAPMYNTLMSTTAGQKLVYETGPRPTPVSVARVILPTQLWGKLVVSLCIDLIGSSSYLLPGVGEVFDLAWAPIQTILIMAMYDPVAPNLKYVSFFEELLPFTDVIPSAVIGWLAEFGPNLLASGSDKVVNSMSSPNDAMVVPNAIPSTEMNPVG